MNWYVVESGQATGPHDHAAMTQLIAQGRVTATTRICVVGATEWVPAAQDAAVAHLLVTANSAMAQPGLMPVAVPAHPPLASTPAPPSDLPPYSWSAASAEATRTLKSRWGVLVLIGLVFLAIEIVLAVPSNTAEQMRQEGGGEAAGAGLLELIGWALALFVGGPLNAGFVLAGARAVRGQGAVGDLFLGFSRFLPVVLATLVGWLVTGLAYAAVLLPGIVVMLVSGWKQGSDSSGWSGGVYAGLLLVGLGALAASIWVMPRLMFMGALAADPSLPSEGVEATLRRSWGTTAGLAPSMFGITLVAGLAAGLTIFLLCIGLPLLGVPWIAAVLGATYAMVFSGGRPGPAGQ